MDSVCGVLHHVDALVDGIVCAALNLLPVDGSLPVDGMDRPRFPSLLVMPLFSYLPSVQPAQGTLHWNASVHGRAQDLARHRAALFVSPDKYRQAYAAVNGDPQGHWGLPCREFAERLHGRAETFKDRLSAAAKPNDGVSREHLLGGAQDVELLKFHVSFQALTDGAFDRQALSQEAILNAVCGPNSPGYIQLSAESVQGHLQRRRTSREAPARSPSIPATVQAFQAWLADAPRQFPKLGEVSLWKLVALQDTIPDKLDVDLDVSMLAPAQLQGTTAGAQLCTEDQQSAAQSPARVAEQAAPRPWGLHDSATLPGVRSRSRLAAPPPGASPADRAQRPTIQNPVWVTPVCRKVCSADAQACDLPVATAFHEQVRCLQTTVRHWLFRGEATLGQENDEACSRASEYTVLCDAPVLLPEQQASATASSLPTHIQVCAIPQASSSKGKDVEPAMSQVPPEVSPEDASSQEAAPGVLHSALGDSPVADIEQWFHRIETCAHGLCLHATIAAAYHAQDNNGAALEQKKQRQASLAARQRTAFWLRENPDLVLIKIPDHNQTVSDVCRDALTQSYAGRLQQLKAFCQQTFASRSDLGSLGRGDWESNPPEVVARRLEQTHGASFLWCDALFATAEALYLKHALFIWSPTAVLLHVMDGGVDISAGISVDAALHIVQLSSSDGTPEHYEALHPRRGVALARTALPNREYAVQLSWRLTPAMCGHFNLDVDLLDRDMWRQCMATRDDGQLGLRDVLQQFNCWSLRCKEESMQAGVALNKQRLNVLERAEAWSTRSDWIRLCRGLSEMQCTHLAGIVSDKDDPKYLFAALVHDHVDDAQGSGAHGGGGQGGAASAGRCDQHRVDPRGTASRGGGGQGAPASARPANKAAFSPRSSSRLSRKRNGKSKGGGVRPGRGKPPPWPAALCKGRVLRNIVVTREPFIVMVRGEKTLEYRENKKYWTRRLLDSADVPRDFQFIHIALGHRRKRTEFLARCLGMHWEPRQPDITFSTNYVLQLPCQAGYWAIELGEIVWSRNVEACLP